MHKLPKEKINKNNKKKLSLKAEEERQSNIKIYLLLRLLVIISLTVQYMRGNWNNVFLCILTLLLFTIPTIITRKFNITLPTTLEIIVYIFIYSAAILGEIQNFYGIFKHWDTLLHTLNGFLCAAVGFSLIDILNNNEDFHISMTPAFVALVAFCFSMTIGVIWEFAEFSADKYLDKDMQKDKYLTKISSVKLNPEQINEPIVIDNIDKTIIYSNNNTTTTIIEGGYLELGLYDTIKDLFVNFIGALIFSILGYLYIKNREEYKFTEVFIMKRKSKIE